MKHFVINTYLKVAEYLRGKKIDLAPLKKKIKIRPTKPYRWK